MMLLYITTLHDVVVKLCLLAKGMKSKNVSAVDTVN